MKNIYNKILSIFLFKKAFKDARHTALSEKAKTKGLESLIIFTEENPVRNSEDARRNMQRSLGTLENLKLIHSIRPMYLLATIALLFTMGGGASFAANDALPNEALYPIKIHVNERVESVLTLNEEAKAEFALNKAELRLQEAETLAVEKELDAKLATKIESRFSSHIGNLINLRHNLEEKGNAQAAAQIDSRIEAMLEVHEAVLAQISSEETPDNATSKGVGQISARVKKALKASQEASLKTSNNNGEAEENPEDKKERNVSKQSTEALMRVAETKLSNTTSFKERVGSKLKTQVGEEAEAELNNANQLIAEGKTELEAKNYQEAFRLFKASLKSTQKAHSLIATSIHLGVDLRTRAKIENNIEQKDSEANTETEVDIEVNTNTQINSINKVRTNSKANINAKSLLEL